MLNIEHSLNNKFPAFAASSSLIKKPTLSILRKLTHESVINAFLEENKDKNAVDFIDQTFDYFDLHYAVSQRDKLNIPAQGRVVIVANHPIGSLDGLAILRLIKEVRSDVKIVANDLLMAITPLHDSLLPLDNMTRSAYKQSYKAIVNALESEQAVIVFPAGEVSRASARGIKDSAWHGGFLHFARKTQSPLLPIHITAKNSLLFYGASMLYKPLGTALLVNEMFNKRSSEIRFRIGEIIPAHALISPKITDNHLIRRLKKHVYKIGKGKTSEFITEKTIAHPEDAGVLKAEFRTAERLGNTRDNHGIYLCDYESHPHILREIGRLRELTFRLVGEGTGAKRDLDKYDHHYRHLVLWDQEKLTIAGAYRLGETKKILAKQGMRGLYSAELFNYSPNALTYFEQGLELGRSFVHPDYWGKASLDYLWQGLGAYLSHNPDVRYLIGPVSMSAQYPRELRDQLVVYYQKYYCHPDALATGKHTLQFSKTNRADIEAHYAALDKTQGFEHLQYLFKDAGHKIPVLYKQYAALFEDDGYRLLDFSVDSDFGHCIDGLFMADLSTMKAAKRARYIPEASIPVWTDAA